MNFFISKVNKDHYYSLIKLGFPIVVGQIGMIIMGFADTIMIGHHTLPELASASFVNGVIYLFIVFGQGFSYGLTPIVGGHYGRKEYSKAGQALKGSILANVLVGAIITVSLLVIYFSLGSMGLPIELIPSIKPYFAVLTISIFFIMLFNAFKQFADGITDTQISMWLLIGGNLLNIAGNYLLIYGHFGFPQMGLLGAGISTLFARVVMVIIFMGIFFRSKRYSLYLKGFYNLPINKVLLHKLNALGWPIAFQMGMETAAFSLSTVMIGWLGTISLAAHQITLTISQICYMVYYGLGTAISIRVSYFKGIGDCFNVRQTAFCGFRLMMFLGLITSSFVVLFRNYWGAIFTNSEEVSKMVNLLMFPLLIYQFGDGLQITFANSLRGISRVKPMMYIAFFAYFVVSLPLGYLFGFVFGWGVIGVWMAFPFGLTTAGLLYYKDFCRSTKYSNISDEVLQPCHTMIAKQSNNIMLNK